MQIKDLGTEKTVPDSSDLIAIQQADGITRHITRENFLVGFGSEPGSSSSGSFVQLLDKKPSGTTGGQAIINSWQTRILNTINIDETGLVSLTNNSFILPAGTYEIFVASTFYRVGDTKIRIQNLTDSNTLMYGINFYFGGDSGSAALQAHLTGKFAIAESKSLALQYYTTSANINIYNLGGSVNIEAPEIYTVIDLRKVN